MSTKLLKIFHFALFGFGLIALAPASGQAAQSDDPDWPCVQRKVPAISAGMVWAGPPVEQVDGTWEQDVEVAQLAGAIARRALDIEQAKQRIADFAAGLDGARNDRLTLLFAGTLDIINRERSTVIEGIGRYARRQADLAASIRDKTAALRTLPEDDSARVDLQEEIHWDTRIYKDREQSLIYVCETPVLLEQRLFALSRAIMSHLEQ